MLGQTQGAQAIGDRARADRQQRAHRQRRNGSAAASDEGGKERRHPRDESLREMQIGADHDRPPGTMRNTEIVDGDARQTRP